VFLDRNCPLSFRILLFSIFPLFSLVGSPGRACSPDHISAQITSFPAFFTPGETLIIRLSTSGLVLFHFLPFFFMCTRMVMGPSPPQRGYWRSALAFFVSSSLFLQKAPPLSVCVGACRKLLLSSSVAYAAFFPPSSSFKNLLMAVLLPPPRSGRFLDLLVVRIKRPSIFGCSRPSNDLPSFSQPQFLLFYEGLRLEEFCCVPFSRLGLLAPFPRRFLRSAEDFWAFPSRAANRELFFG